MELEFDDTKKRLFKKKLGHSFFKNQSKMGQGINFSKFWSVAFESTNDPREIVSFLNVSEDYLYEGPVKKWIALLRNKFIFFVWSYSNLSLRDLRKSLKLRDQGFTNYLFFLASEDGYSNKFFLKEEFEIEQTLFEDFNLFLTSDTFFSEGLSNLELVLFPSWCKLLEEMEKGAKEKKFKQSSGFLKYIGGYLVAVVIGIAIISSFIVTSTQEAREVLRKLTISIPSFENIDVLSTLEAPKVLSEMARENIEFEEQVESNNNLERVDTETEIEYLEFEEIKNKFSSLGKDKTEFEEETKGVFREARYGYSTVYRLMIETVDSYSFLEDFKQLQKEFKFEKAGKVEPGLFIPGGNYFNLLVNTQNFGGLLKRLQKYKPMIYASKSKGKKISGKTKVFIFVNKI